MCFPANFVSPETVCIRKYYQFKVPVLPLCHLIVPGNGRRIVCSDVEKAAANAGSRVPKTNTLSSSLKRASVERG